MCKFKSAILYRRPDEKVQFLALKNSDSHSAIATHHDLQHTIDINNQHEQECVAFIEILHDGVKLDGPTEMTKYNWDGTQWSQETKEENPWVHEFVQSKLKVMCRYRNIVGWEKIKREKENEALEAKRRAEYEKNSARYARRSQQHALLVQQLKKDYPFERTVKDRLKLHKYKVDPKEYQRKKIQRALRVNFEREWKRELVLRAIRRNRKLREYVMKRVFEHVQRVMMQSNSSGRFIQFKKPTYWRDFNFQIAWDAIMKTGYYNGLYWHYPTQFDLVTLLHTGEWIRHGKSYNQTNALRNLMEVYP